MKNMEKPTIINTPNPTSSGSGEGKHDLIDRQAALKKLAAYIHLIDKTMGKGILTDDDCMEAAKSVLGEDEIPAVQPDHNADSDKKADGDMISRKAAIDALDKRFDNVPMEQTAEILKLRKDLRELPSAQPATNCSEIPNGSDDTISRRAAIDAIGALSDAVFKNIEKGATFPKRQWFDGMANAESIIKDLPSAQPERDIPIKPYETTDTAWGISVKQAVCPKCDYYLGHVAFLGDYKGKKVTYCETCGQAIDWEGWEQDD